MNRSIVLLALLVTLLAALARPLLAADAPAESQADKDWQAFEKAQESRPPADKDLSPKEDEEWGEQYWLKVRELGLAFIEKHPSDVRRWKIVLSFYPEAPAFVKEWGPLDANGVPTNNVVDKAAVAAWKAKVEELRAAMAKATDLTPELRDSLAVEEMTKPLYAAVEAQERGETVDLASLRARLVDFAAKHPENKDAKHLLSTFAYLVEKRGFTNLPTEFGPFVNSPNKGVAEVAKGKLAFAERARKPLAIAFTAVDGRKVDLKKLRGKVVLVDFWATWCGPCVAEMPNVKKAYDEFHGQGFEVVGIALEDAQLEDKDTPEQQALKLAAAKKKLTQFLSKRNIPWPQYFDGKGWKSDISSKYALSGIPAMFLLDQQGRLVTTDAHGETLAREIKRLLKL